MNTSHASRVTHVVLKRCKTRRVYFNNNDYVITMINYFGVVYVMKTLNLSISWFTLIAKESCNEKQRNRNRKGP